MLIKINSMKAVTTITLIITIIVFRIDSSNGEKSKSVNLTRQNSDESNENQPLKINLSSNATVLLNATKEIVQLKTSQPTVTVTKRKISQSTTIIQKSSTPKLSPIPKPEKRDFFECPNTSHFEIFSSYCTNHTNCRNSGENFRCCKQYGSKRCVKGVFKPLKEQRHEPILGIIPRKCPSDPLAESFWEVKSCKFDQDCWPRICCPDGKRKYCRTSKPELENVAVLRQLAYPIESLSSYLQCTPPPPSLFDAFPKRCNNTLDCFPNICCQESGKKHCRPPKRSLLALVTGFAQQFNRGFIKEWTENLVIRR